MSSSRLVDQLRIAHAHWRSAPPRPGTERGTPTLMMTTEQAAKIMAQARELLEGTPDPRPRNRDSAVIVTKSPHAGSTGTVTAIIARCLAFGLHIEQVVRKRPEDAESIAHALYPDVWLNFARMPSGRAAWDRLAEIFDRDHYHRIFGRRYQRGFVVTGHQARLDNALSNEELTAIWQTGREPLRYADAAADYGRAAADLLFQGTDSGLYHWYRGPYPIGIQKIGSSLMAFALRHRRLYDGRPVILLNGHFSLLSQRFHGSNGGAAVIEIGLDHEPTIHEIRHRLIGASDDPRECLPGSVRRDAYDRFFDTDAPDVPVTAWANAIHGSDGYLAGAIEAEAIFGVPSGGVMRQRLCDLGYAPAEVDMLIMRDPIVVVNGDEQRLTKRTALCRRDECISVIQRYFPPLRQFGFDGTSRYPMPEMMASLGQAEAVRPGVDRPRREPASRRPPIPPLSTASLPLELVGEGESLIASGRVGFLAPCAGAGGRFGGYRVREGDRARLKMLLPLFDVAGCRVSALDIRAAHARFLTRQFGAPVPMFVSCGHLTEPHVNAWLSDNADVRAVSARVPEMYRVRVDDPGTNADAVAASPADRILRDLDGTPLLKPIGNLGLLIAATRSGTLRDWADRGVSVVIVANTDDVGFRVDARILGLFTTTPDLDAVVLTTSIRDGDGPGAPSERGGLLRERAVTGGWSAYVEEHAELTPPYESEQFNTNQMYFRLSSLCRALGDCDGRGIDAARCALPLYFELKPARVGDREATAAHAYQAYSDILRRLSNVVPFHLSRAPVPGQRGAHATLKSGADVEFAQSVLDTMAAAGDELLFDRAV